MLKINYDKKRAESNKSLLPLLKSIRTSEKKAVGEKKMHGKKSIRRFHFQLLLFLWLILCKFCIVFFFIIFLTFLFSFIFQYLPQHYMCLHACSVVLFYFVFFFLVPLLLFRSPDFQFTLKLLLHVSFSQSTL